MTFKPYPKEEQLSRGPQRQKRKKASKGAWERIAESKQGPCRVCGGAPPNELHHLVPRAQGGGDVADNCVPLCRVCHRAVTRYDKEACAALRVSLTDAEYAYANEMFGEVRFEAHFPGRSHELPPRIPGPPIPESAVPHVFVDRWGGGYTERMLNQKRGVS